MSFVFLNHITCNILTKNLIKRRVGLITFVMNVQWDQLW